MSSSVSDFNSYLAGEANSLEIPCCFCETTHSFYPTEVNQILVCGACETCTAVMVDGFVPVESKGIPVISVSSDLWMQAMFMDSYCPQPNFLNYSEWCFPGDWAMGIFA